VALTALRIVKKSFIARPLHRRLRKQATDLAGAVGTLCGDGGPPSGATEGNYYATRIDNGTGGRNRCDGYASIG
jgi:hypothetical protein